MVIDNKYMVGRIGWLPDRCTHGVELYFFPDWERDRPMHDDVIHHSNFTFAWRGWKLWPFINWQLDERR